MARTSSRNPVPPKEQFQQEVRKLTSEDVRRHRRNESISLNYNPYELQHTSGHRFSPLRRVPYKTSASSLRQVVEETDFGIEERDVWSKRSPVNKAREDPEFHFVLHEEVIPSPSQQHTRDDSIPPLRRVPSHVDLDDRPRTRRGPEGPSAFEEIGHSEEGADVDSIKRSARGTKFKEGTMTSRSESVASTWSDSEYATSASETEETDTETTPKALQKRRSNSFDLREFQPPALTPSAIKRTLFRRAPDRKNKKNDAEKKGLQEHDKAMGPEKPKKRIRKSMSKLHFLGEKMKIFASSSQDLPEQAKEETTQLSDAEKSVLDDRKRKAEAAYAEQFGFKKQRDNSGLGNMTSLPGNTDNIGAGGNQKYDSSTVRRRGGETRSRRTSTGSVAAAPMPTRQDSFNTHDIRKRPSRRELEKENQQLRALLREARVGKPQEDAITSDVEVEPTMPPVPPLRVRRNRSGSFGSALSTESNFCVAPDAAVAADIPPVPPLPPQHPDRKILGNISNSPSRRARRESFGVVSDCDPKESEDKKDCSSALQNVPKLVPTPERQSKRSMAPRHSMPALSGSVSMIPEEPEDEIEEKKRSLRSRQGLAGKENTTHLDVNKKLVQREDYEWPEDVF